jgi:Dynamin family
MVAIGRQRGDARNKSCTAELAGWLDQASAMLEASVSPDSPLTTRMRALHDRLVSERLQLAVLGQFKRGKSTFLNALLGAPLLPTGVVPLTAVATFIIWGPEPLVRVVFKDQRAAEQFPLREPDDISACLFRFVAEEANPNNRLGIARVELEYPAPVLASGTVLIDTPGVGSTLRHNTDAARQVLPECDAALFVLSPDPPITEIELEYLRLVKARVSRIFFLLNKIDYLAPEEQRSAIDFLRKVLSEKSLIDDTAQVFCLSARQALAAKKSNNGDELKSSGIAALQHHLDCYLATEKVTSLEDAVRTKAAEILGQAAAELDLRGQALRMPLEQLASKSRTFEEALHSIEQQRLVVRDLLACEKRRLREKLDSRTDALWVKARARLAGVIDDSLAGRMSGTWQQAVRFAIAAAMETVFDKACSELSGAFAAETNPVLSAHRDRIAALIETVQHAAAEIFDISFAQQHEHEPFRLGEDPYWVTENVDTTLIPDMGWVFDYFVPLIVRRARRRARIVGKTDRLILRNVANLHWAIQRGLDETFRSESWRLEERMDDAIKAISRVVGEALELRQDRSFVLHPEIERLVSDVGSLRDLLRDLNSSKEDTFDAAEPASSARASQ